MWPSTGVNDPDYTLVNKPKS